MRRAGLAFSILLLAGATTQCGPSVAAVYEGKVRFEHCYRLDLDTNIAPTHREACWRGWTERYTYGQTRDRLDYARRRIATLASGDRRRPQLSLDRAMDPMVPAAPEAPVPTSLHAPPPPLAQPVTPVDAGVEAAAAPSAEPTKDAGPAPPGAECTPLCEMAWRNCFSRCDPDAGRRSTCGACKADYSQCLQRCLK